MYNSGAFADLLDEVDRLPIEVRIPLHSGHPFQSIPDSDSAPFRTPIPIHSGHPFRFIPDTHFD